LLKSPLYVKLKSLNDFARLVCSLERVPLPVFGYSYNDEEILAVNTDGFIGRPIFYYINCVCSDDAQYLCYKISGNSEDVSLVDSIKNASALYAPIIKMTDLPSIFLKNPKITNSYKYTCIGLKDVSSLSKIAAFRINFDESPMPLLHFPYEKTKKSGVAKENFVLGTYFNMSDSDEYNYFYYVIQDQSIDKNFLKFSAQKANKPVYTDFIDEHGFIYLKIIKLDESHPLVKIT
jgi:hypothetical protein